MTSATQRDAGQPPSSAPWNIRRILDWTREHLAKSGSESARLEAEVLLAHAMGLQRIQLYVNYQQVLTDAERARMRELVTRRATGEPVAYLVGFREFFSLPIKVNRAVLIPRPETETLVVEAMTALQQHAAQTPRLLDLCTGSGCIAVAIAKNVQGVQVTATDLSADSLTVAQDNAAALRVADRIEFLHGDLFAAVPPESRFHVVASNPPYVASAEIAGLSRDVRNHEPHHALDGGPDGLDLVRIIVRQAPEFLVPGGRLLIEVSPEQIPAVGALIESDARYSAQVTFKDFAGLPRIVSAEIAS